MFMKNFNDMGKCLWCYIIKQDMKYFIMYTLVYNMKFFIMSTHNKAEYEIVYNMYYIKL